MVSDQVFGEFREVVGGVTGALGFDSRRVQARDDTRHEQHHDDVDTERGPVLRGPDVEVL
jgi:hypothetical protein